MHTHTKKKTKKKTQIDLNMFCTSHKNREIDL